MVGKKKAKKVINTKHVTASEAIHYWSKNKD